MKEKRYILQKSKISFHRCPVIPKLIKIGTIDKSKMVAEQ